MLRQLPNLLSGARLLASPVLAALAFMQQETVFTWVLIPALLSDILDGLIARMFTLESRLGAILDSVADTLLMLVSCYGIWVFHPEVIREHAVAVRDGDRVVAARGRARARCATGACRASTPTCRKSSPTCSACSSAGCSCSASSRGCCTVAAGASILASLEELALLRALPQWRADVRGLWWVLRGG